MLANFQNPTKLQYKSPAWEISEHHQSCQTSPAEHRTRIQDQIIGPEHRTITEDQIIGPEHRTRTQDQIIGREHRTRAQDQNIGPDYRTRKQDQNSGTAYRTRTQDQKIEVFRKVIHCVLYTCQLKNIWRLLHLSLYCPVSHVQCLFSFSLCVREVTC